MENIQYQIKLWLKNEEKAFEEVFKYYYPRLFRYAFRYLKNDFWAEELSMEVLGRVWERKPVITHESFENYLFTAARNHLINHWQRKIDGLLSLEALPTEGEGIAGKDDASAYDPVLSRELETVYNDSLSELPPQRRLIFHLHRNEHLSYKEIASKLHISPRTVENHIAAALKQLRVAMMQYLTSIIL
ncbi:RNA polymerase sigma-70 factor [Puia dinghuensis]|uniref:DNA-directed RNA polymerase sigma-70 factor n=1 Tax=Puia dinghuensis TaxID=1792502 RepID=A0A8J2XRR2_9BACT|nr:RNA polymerase sigma-70 factor [Puia dinghuensis]GGB03463.1 DNA-directed RNA polymerase sigma-70 factor [Puia dinghuensis]